MKDNIFSICLGNNLNNLKGSVNDSILMYNYIYRLSLNTFQKQKWIKPNILINNKVAVSNLIDILNKSKKSFNKLYLFFSGHGFSNGKLNIYRSEKNKNIVSLEELIHEINKHVKKIDLFITLDSCYSGNRITNYFSNIDNINIISSTNLNEKASESIVTYHNEKKNIFRFKNLLNIKNNNFIAGVFTYNFIYLLDKSRIFDICNFKNVICNNFDIWSKIKTVANQTASIF